jgi:hypothetical protein
MSRFTAAAFNLAELSEQSSEQATRAIETDNDEVAQLSPQESERHSTPKRNNVSPQWANGNRFAALATDDEQLECSENRSADDDEEQAEDAQTEDGEDDEGADTKHPPAIEEPSEQRSIYHNNTSTHNNEPPELLQSPRDDDEESVAELCDQPVEEDEFAEHLTDQNAACAAEPCEQSEHPTFDTSTDRTANIITA